MKSLGEAPVSAAPSPVIEVLEPVERDEPGREEDTSMDLGRDLLREREESDVFCFLLGEPSSRFVKVKTRLRGRERERLVSLPSADWS